MDLLVQTSQSIMSPSKTAVIYRTGHMKCTENLEPWAEVIT